MTPQRLRRENHKECLTLCEARKLVWRAFQSSGFIPSEQGVNVTEKRCNEMSGMEFKDLTLGVYLKFKGKFDKKKQKEDYIREMYRQISFEDRVKVRDLLRVDIDLLGYQLEPENVFPELYK